MKRVGAIVGAVLMVVAALAIRSRIDDNGDGGASGPIRVACVPELRAACDALGAKATVTVEDASVTAGKLIGGSTEYDAWVTFDGWPELVDVALQRTQPTTATPLASSPLVIAGEKHRMAALRESTCPIVSWRCLLTSAGQPWSAVGGSATWGNVKVGMPPATSAIGLLVRANALTELATEGLDVAVNDPDYAASTALIDKAITDPDVVADFFRLFPATYAAIGSDQAAIEAQAGSLASSIDLGTPTPTAIAVAEVAALTSAGSHVDTKKLTAPLVSAGWTTPPAASSGLPDPGVLLALSGLGR